MPSTPLAPREIHLYYDDDHNTADIVVVYALGSGQLATRLHGDGHLTHRHNHRDGGAGPSTDTISLELTLRDALTGAGRNRANTPGEVTA
jgi:hypothetical protein